MCVVCVTVAGTLVVASQVTPIEVLSEFTSSQRTLTSFTGTSSTLSAKQRSEIKALVEGSPEADTVVCTGLTIKGASRAAIATARTRAKASCDYAKRLNPFFETSVVTRTTSTRSNAGRVTVQLRTPKQEASVPETPGATSPTPLPKPSDVYSAPSESSDKIDLCKIKETSLSFSRQGRAWDGPDAPIIQLPSGFPAVEPSSKRTGNIKWAMIPIDFPDLRGDSTFRNRIDDQMAMLSDWLRTVSEGNITVTWTVANKWVTLPSNSTQYEIRNSANLGTVPDGEKLFKDAMAAADPIFDFTNIQNVVFLLPKGQTFLRESSQGFPWDKAVIEMQTGEGRISSYSIAGYIFDPPTSEQWSYWAHEFGHAISLPHIGASRGTAPLYAGFDLMAAQNGPTRDLSGWLRFVAEWLPDEKVYCKEFKSITNLDLTLVPLNSSEQGLKLAVIPVSNTKALVIESRRDTKFSCQMQPGQNGIFVYTYDADLGHGLDFLVPLAPAGRSVVQTNCRAVPPITDSVLRTGDKLSFEGITIENLSSGNFDKIRISR
jgi:M6 family metalloprotease-like protein